MTLAASRLRCAHMPHLSTSIVVDNVAKDGVNPNRLGTKIQVVRFVERYTDRDGALLVTIGTALDGKDVDIPSITGETKAGQKSLSPFQGNQELVDVGGSDSTGFWICWTGAADFDGDAHARWLRRR